VCSSDLESGLPRLYREAPLNSIWEGSGNVTALDVLRALTRGSEPADALFAELERAGGGDRRLDEACGRLRRLLPGLAAAGPDAEYAARRLAGMIAVTLQAALLVRHAPAAVADAFCASRLGSGSSGSGSPGTGPGDSGGLRPGPGVPGGPGVPYGTLPEGVDCEAILDRATALPR
jgi:putative acyl-CoA dehydrogenase